MFQGHGDDGYRHHQPITADFSTNVYHGGVPSGLKEYLFSQWDKVQRYPEVLAESLTEKIAWHYSFNSSQVLVTNGSTESIYLMAQAFRSKRSAIVIPAFAEYEDACRMHGHEMSFIRWEELNADQMPDIDLLFICNPNNPTGAVKTDLEQVIQRHPGILFIVDEAFIEFTFAVTSLVMLTEKYVNLVIMRSMTKAYAIPGLRLGYIIAQPALISLFRSFKLPWTVNVMALEAGHFIFDHFNHIQVPLQQLLSDKTDFVQGLKETPLTIHTSHTHFFLAETQQGNAAELKRFLLDHFHILIRDAGNFKGLNEHCIRIATLSPAKNELLINALSAWKPI
jgi:threonine-phosphate decarboxylase